MVAEVDKILRNALVGSRAVELPGIGSLCIEVLPADRERHLLTPARQLVSFTSQSRGVSLVAAIAREIGGDTVQARDIYGRWLEQVRRDDRLVIGGVGTLRQKSFIVDDDFARLLNPSGTDPVRLKPRNRRGILFGVAAAVLLLAGAGCLFGLFRSGSAAPEDPATAETAAAGTAAAGTSAALSDAAERGAGRGNESGEGGESGETVRPAAGVPDGAATEAGAEPAGSAVAGGDARRAGADAGGSAVAGGESRSGQGTPALSGQLVSKRTYAVYGVFTTEGNALRAAEAIGDPEVEARVYRFGAKWMVSLGDADDREACNALIRTLADRYPDLWPYTAR